MTNGAPNFRLPFLDGDGAMMLANRPLSAADADDAAREAAFGDWPADARERKSRKELANSMDGTDRALTLAE
jgi:hypothetical protein